MSAHQSNPVTPLPTLYFPAAPSTSENAQTQPSLPTPSTFDFLPLLHELLSRVLTSETTNDLTTDASLAAIPPCMYPNEPPLAIQQLITEVSKIRNHIRRARLTVEALPDMERNLEEQNDEINNLRKRMKSQRSVLTGLTRPQ